MVKGQRWKVLGGQDGLIAREGPEEYSRILPEVLPTGAVVEEQELKGNRLHFIRLSGRGPYTGWVDVKDGRTELLFKVEKKTVPSVVMPTAVEDDLDGTAKRKKGEEKWRPMPAPAPEIPLKSPGDGKLPRPGRFWRVVGAPKDGLKVWQGVSETSPIFPGTLPQGAVVEEVQVVGNRLSFTDFSMRGPPSGWVNIRENGRDMLVIDTEGLSTLNIAEALRESAGMHLVPPANVEPPLSGWAKMAEMYQKPEEKNRMDIAAAAAETADSKKRRKRRTVAAKEMPQLEELAHATEETLVDVLGFPEQEAKHFAMLNEESKQRVITECRALIDMSPLERQEAFEKLRKAWPRGPFPSFAKPSENLPPVSNNLLPRGTCFPLKRPSMKTPAVSQPLASALDGKPGFFAPQPLKNVPEQKKALQSLAKAVTPDPSQEVACDPSIALMDLCRLPQAKADPEKISKTVITKGKLSSVDVAIYLASEMKTRPILLDSGPGAKLRSAKLSEADFRGERAKVLRDSAPQMGNLDLLTLSKPTLVAETHKDYLKAGVDICCTNTLKANALAQKEYKTAKLVSEMNKSAALLAKRAASEVTKLDIKKPRLVAGLVGPCEARTNFDDMVDAYSEQIKGLAEGGVDLLALEMYDARSAKAAIYASGEVYKQLKQRVPPCIIHVHVDPKTGRTLGGQSAHAFYVSVKHCRPLAVGIVGGAAYGDLAKAGSFIGMKSGEAELKGLKELPNFVGLTEGLPQAFSTLAALKGPTRSLPEVSTKLMVSGLESHTVDSFTLVGQRGSTRAYGKFKELMDDFKSNGRHCSLSKAVDLCALDCESGADILDICVDGIANDGSNRGSKTLMNKFTTLCDSDARVAKAPFMLCSSDMKVVKEGLGNLQGRCIVNALCLMVGEDEFLQLAKEVMKYGAALVVMAIGEQGRAVTAKDKVEVLQRSYRLLRQKLDFPPEDIILDCHLQTLRHDEHPSEVMSAISELKRSCPRASLTVGLSNLSAAFGRLGKLREALHSTFLQHAIPKGLNMALAPAGRLPLYAELEQETRQVCEDVILNSKKDETPLKRFMAFLNFRSGATVCLPLQAAESADDGAWWTLPECKAAGKEAQQQYLEKRGPKPPAAQQKAYWQALKPAFANTSKELLPDAGCERPNPARVPASGGSGALQQQVSTALASGTKVTFNNLLAYLNTTLGKKLLVTDGPNGPQDQLSGQDEAAFRGPNQRFPAQAKNNLDLLSITKPDLVLNAHRALLKAGADIIRTNTRNGDGLCQAFYGTEDATYELNKAAATVANKAVIEWVSQSSQPKFVAGVIGPSTGGGLSSPKTKTTWDQMVDAYRPQVRGLVDGGVHLLVLDMVSDTLNAKAAIYAIQEHFDLNPKERLPLLINVSLKGGRTPSGQSPEACWVSLSHAQPLAFGVGGDGAAESIPELARTCQSWVQLTGDTPRAGINIFSPSASSPKDIQDAVAKLEKAALSPRVLPNASKVLQLSSLEAVPVNPSSGLKLVGQRCHVQGSHRFKGLVHALKYTSDDEDIWDAALEVATKQVEDEADLLDLNFDSPNVDAPSAMGKFVRRCSLHPKVAKVPLVISSMSWKVIAEGLKNTQGKCIVNGLSVASSEEEFLRAAEECKRFGAAIIVLALPRVEGNYPNYQEKVQSCQRAYQLLRNKLDFPPEDIIFDCLLTPVGSAVRASAKDFIDAVAEVKRTCPGTSFTAGVSNLSHGARTAAMLREALASAFLKEAIPKGLNFAFVELGHLPPLENIEEPTRSMCMDVMSHQAADGPHVARVLNFASFLSGSSVADEALRKAPKNTLQRKDKAAMVPVVQKQSPPEPLRPSPQFTHPVEILVQATGTVSSSIFQTFGSKAHAAVNYHRLITATTINRTVHFSSISVYMGQGGSGPVTGASGVMDGLSLWERHQGINQYSTTVLWGAIGEIGLRKAIYGSRDVFAQFDLGQKLIGPADTAFLERVVCCNPATWDFVGLAYLDQTWQDSLAGRGSTTGLQGRKTFVDN